jgi:hypothetical protein
MHAVAIRLHDGGFGDGAIAVALGTDPEQVPPLLRIAVTKLARLLAEDDAEAIDLTSPRADTTTLPCVATTHVRREKEIP